MPLDMRLLGIGYSSFFPFLATATVTPSGGAGASAGAGAGSGGGAGAGAGAGSSGAGTGTGTATPPPVSTHVADGHQGEGALTPDQSVDAMVAAFEAKAGKTTDSTQTSDGKPPVVEAAKTETDNLSAAKTEATATTEKRDATTQTDATDDTDGYTFEQDSFVGARDLAAKINAIPELAAALPQDLRDEIMANARLAETLAPYKEIFGSPEEAKIISSSAQEHANLMTVFSGIRGDNVAKNTTALLDAMFQLSAVKDEQGNPVKGPDGKIRTDGTVGRFLKEMLGRRFGVEEAKIKQEGDQEMLAALDMVMGRFGLRTPTADKDQNESEDIKRQRADLAAQKADFDRRQAEGEAKATREYSAALNSDLKSLTDGEIGKLLANATGISDDLTKSAVEKALNDAITAGVKANTAYQLEKEQILSRPATPARRAEEVRLAKTFLRNHLAGWANPILDKATLGVKKRGEQRAAEQAARAEKAQGEVSGGSASVSRPAAATGSDPTSVRAAAVTALKAELAASGVNREPSDSEINIYLMLNNSKLKKTA